MNKKIIPTNIQNAIDLWKSNNIESNKPKTIKLKNINEYNVIKHYDCLIEFPPGGQTIIIGQYY